MIKWLDTSNTNRPIANSILPQFEDLRSNVDELKDDIKSVIKRMEDKFIELSNKLDKLIDNEGLNTEIVLW